MVKSSTNNPFFFVGRQVLNEHGRPVGRIASFMISPNGRIDSVLIEHGDGEFLRYPSSQLKVGPEGIILLSPIKQRAKSLCDDIPLIWRKGQALRELFEKKKIPPEMFDELNKSFEKALDRLKADAQKVLEEVERRIERCAQQIREFYSAIVCLEVEHEIGRIDDKSYQTAKEIIQKGLRWVTAEKEDLEAVRKRLSNVLLGEKAAEEAPPAPQTEEEPKGERGASPHPTLPEPPSVVHVKG